MATLNNLKTTLQSQLAAGVTLNSAFFKAQQFTMADNIDSIIKDALFPDDDKGVLKVTAASPVLSLVGDTLRITASKGSINTNEVLGIKKPNVTELTFSLTKGQLDFTITFDLDTDWTFKQSFPSPGSFPGAVFSFGNEPKQFIFSSKAPAQEIAMGDPGLRQGLNFAAKIDVSKLKVVTELIQGFGVSPADFKKLLPTRPILLTGDIQPMKDQMKTYTFPNLELAAVLAPNFEVDLGFIKVENLRLGVQMFLNQSPTYFVALDLKLGGNTSELIASISPSGNKIIQMGIRGVGSAITLPDLLNLKSGGNTMHSMWGAGMNQGIFKDFLNDFGLIYFNATVALGAPPSVISFDMLLGITKPIPLYKSLTLDQLNVQWTCMHPLKHPNHFLMIDAEFNVGKTVFDISATHQAGQPGWLFTGEAKNVGTLSALIEDIATATGVDNSLPQLPDDVGDLEDIRVSFDTHTKDVTFSCVMGFGGTSKLNLNIHILHQEGGKVTKEFSGQLKFESGLEFDVIIVSDGTSTDFIATYQEPTTSAGIKLSDLVGAVMDSPPAFLDDFDIDIKDALLAYHAEKGKNRFVFAIDIGAGVNLSDLGDLPLVGGALSGLETMKMSFKAMFSPQGYTIAQLQELNKHLSGGGPKFPDAKNLAKGGIELSTELHLSDRNISVVMPVEPHKNAVGHADGTLTDNGTTAVAPTGSSPTDSGMHWIKIGKKFGPVEFQRVGFKFEKPSLTASLDGSVSLFGLELDLMGLSVSVPLTGLSKFHPSFSLHGLGLNLQKGPLNISGAFLNMNNEYSGLATIEVEDIGLSAIGSFAELPGGDPSLFIYGMLDFPLGGPTFFFVTGLAAGFGINRSVTIPPLNKIMQFPFVSIAMNPDETSKPPTSAAGAQDYLTKIMTEMDEYIRPELGQYFVAAGLRFTSFELLDTFALLSVQFGKRFEIDLVGISTLLLPPDDDKPLAEAQLALKVTFIPEEGYLLAQAQLTNNSYILSKDCMLTGGFAFASWFSGEHAGDFVVTLGGYHPVYHPPSYFPKVPRLGFNWKVSDSLSIKGAMYFALVPHILMAGGSLHATFHSGSIKAWFIIGADFLICWKPFHYLADVYLSLGIEATIHFFGTHHLTFSASADLNIWGPKFGGHGHVSLTIIGFKFHFDVDFGATAPVKPPMTWLPVPATQNITAAEAKANAFKLSFLPKDDAMVGSTVKSGILKKVDVPIGKKEITHYIINPKEFSIATNSSIPIKTVATTGVNKRAGGLAAALWDNRNQEFGVAPMEKAATEVASTHKVMITLGGTPANDSFIINPVIGAVPAAMWGTSNPNISDKGSANKKSMIENVVTGFEVLPATPVAPGVSKAIDRSKFAYNTSPQQEAFAFDNSLSHFAASSTRSTDPAANQKIWQTIQNSIAKNTVRQDILSEFYFNEAELNYSLPFEKDAVNAPQIGALV